METLESSAVKPEGYVSALKKDPIVTQDLSATMQGLSSLNDVAFLKIEG